MTNFTALPVIGHEQAMPSTYSHMLWVTRGSSENEILKLSFDVTSVIALLHQSRINSYVSLINLLVLVYFGLVALSNSFERQ